MKTTTNKKSQKQAGSYKAEILKQTGIENIKPFEL